MKKNKFFFLLAISMLFFVPIFGQEQRQPSPLTSLSEQLAPTARQRLHNFGKSIAMDGELAIVGAPDNLHGLGANAAFLYQRQTDGHWAETAQFLPPNNSTAQGFGYAVAIAGRYAYVSAHAATVRAANGTPLREAGTVFVYRQASDDSWQLHQTLHAPTPRAEQLFGCALSATAEGLLVGAIGPNGQGGTGSAIHFPVTEKGVLAHKAQVWHAANPTKVTAFGWSVSLKGGSALVGAIMDRTPEDAVAGSAYRFERLSAGEWTQGHRLLAPDGAEGDMFGYSVAVSGSEVLVGAVAKPGASATERGAAYLFERSPNADWAGQRLRVPGSAGLGASVAIEGGTVLLGALGHARKGLAGSVYALERSEKGVWNAAAAFSAEAVHAQDMFGQAVALSGDQVLVGAFGPGASGDESGRVHAFAHKSKAVAAPAEFQLEAYPNPSSGQLSVKFPPEFQAENVGVLPYRIADLRGRTVKAGQISPTSPKIDLRPLENGVYFLAIDLEGRPYTLRIVLQTTSN
ncbi:MAG: T9SS type A sorting domain-containing protein [Bacteroidota bacterium]